jgi:hypothetical protein
MMKRLWCPPPKCSRLTDLKEGGGGSVGGRRREGGGVEEGAIVIDTRVQAEGDVDIPPGGPKYRNSILSHFNETKDGPAPWRTITARELTSAFASVDSVHALVRERDGPQGEAAAAWLSDTLSLKRLDNFSMIAPRFDYLNAGNSLPTLRVWSVLVLVCLSRGVLRVAVLALVIAER